MNNHPKSLSLSNIKFLLNIQINTLHTKHIKQILVILFESQQEIRLEILTGNTKFFNLLKHTDFPVFHHIFHKR